MSAVIRLPAMVYQFHLALSRQKEAELMKTVEKEAIQYLEDKITEENQTTFFDRFLENLESSLKKQKYGRSRYLRSDTKERNSRSKSAIRSPLPTNPSSKQPSTRTVTRP